MRVGGVVESKAIAIAKKNKGGEEIEKESNTCEMVAC